jgi:predicted nucleotidyltransferase
VDKSELSRQITLVLQDLSCVHLAYLFGSQADGEPGPPSDVDVGVLVERGGDEAQLQARLTHELGKTVHPLRVDVVLLHHAPIELAYAIISQGICVYQYDTLTRVEYEANVLSRYGDYLPVLRAQHRQIILEEGGHDHRVQRYREALGRTQRALGAIRAAQK